MPCSQMINEAVKADTRARLLVVADETKSLEAMRRAYGAPDPSAKTVYLVPGMHLLVSGCERI